MGGRGAVRQRAGADVSLLFVDVGERRTPHHLDGPVFFVESLPPLPDLGRGRTALAVTFWEDGEDGSWAHLASHLGVADRDR